MPAGGAVRAVPPWTLLWPMAISPRTTALSGPPYRDLDDGDVGPRRRGGATPARAARAATAATPLAPRDPASAAIAEDQRLVTALAPLVTRSTLVRLAYLPIGFSAIGALTLAYIEVLPLPLGARYILLPAVIAGIVLGVTNREWGWRALIGFTAGVVATAVDDVVRLSLGEMGLWEDPIPEIGDLLLAQLGVDLRLGYTWRLFGNGAGMGVAFAMLPWRGTWAGLLYGTAIASGLVAVLALFPVAQTHFFPLLPSVVAGAMLIHWVYGGVLGWLVGRRIPGGVVRVPGRRRG